MPRLSLVLMVGLFAAALGLPGDAYAQNTSPGGWLTPDWNKPPITAANRKPAPRRDLTGMWAPADGAGAGTQAQGVPSKPNNGRLGNARSGEHTAGIPSRSQ